MRRNVLILLGLSLLSAAVFAQTRNFEFINYDDPGNVSARPELRNGLTWPGVRWAFTTTFVGNYIPVTGLTLLADYSLHGLDAGGYHITNVLLHTLNGLLLFLFLARTTGAPWPSAVVAALFLVHPLRVESVAWISERKDLTCGLFWMLTLHAYVPYARRPRIGPYVLVFAGTCLALLSKPMAVTLPCVLFLLDFWPLERMDSAKDWRSASRLVLEKLPLAVPVIISAATTIAIQQESGALSSVDTLPVADRIGNALHAYFAYVATTLVPRNLIPIYPFDASVASLASPSNLAILAAIAVLTVMALRFARRAPWWPVGWFWYLGTLVPVIGFVQVGAQSTADRYTYLPQIGLLVVAVWSARSLAARVPAGRVLAAATAVAAIAGYTHLAHRQTAHWRDSVTLWSYAVGVMPANAIAQSLLGAALIDVKDPAAAREHLEAALRVQLMHRPALLNLAKLDVQDENFDAALAGCEMLIGLRPDDPAAHTTWSSILIRQHRPQEALDHIGIALDADPNYADALVNRAAALLMLGWPEDAFEAASRAIRLAPDDPAAFTNLATASLEMGRAGDARRYCAHALTLDPQYAPALTLQRDLDALPQ